MLLFIYFVKLIVFYKYILFSNLMLSVSFLFSFLFDSGNLSYLLAFLSYDVTLHLPKQKRSMLALLSF